MAKSANSEGKRERILQTALELFAEKGYHSATTKEIAGKCGVAEGLLFYYFGGKRGLLEQVVREFSFHEAAKTRMDELLHMEPEEALVQFGSMYLSFLDRHKSLLMLIWSPEMMRDETITAEVLDLLEGMAEQGAVLLARIGQGVAIPPHSLQAGVSMLLSSILIHFAIAERMKNRTPEADQAYIRTLVAILARGLPSAAGPQS